jgi:hypothetical protein
MVKADWLLLLSHKAFCWSLLLGVQYENPSSQ